MADRLRQEVAKTLQLIVIRFVLEPGIQRIHLLGTFQLVCFYLCKEVKLIQCDGVAWLMMKMNGMIDGSYIDIIRPRRRWVHPS